MGCRLTLGPARNPVLAVLALLACSTGAEMLQAYRMLHGG